MTDSSEEKSLRKRLSLFLTGVSFLLALIIAPLWVRSYWQTDEIRIHSVNVSPATFEIISAAGTRQGGFYLAQHKLNWSWSMDAYDHQSETINYELVIGPGKVNGPVALAEQWNTGSLQLFESGWSALGFHFRSPAILLSLNGASIQYIVIPMWILFIVFAFAPIRWLIIARITRRRRLESHCPVCGYDLRASPDRCPECGTTPSTKSS